ncbi:hypothetical protein, partial [Parafrankia sp. FMc2]|uniref:hypothetical protein n=1 Tax=Parafrankia sp. FMc2 TaxID=3233196 RepID=UPI0034D61C75
GPGGATSPARPAPSASAVPTPAPPTPAPPAPEAPPPAPAPAPALAAPAVADAPVPRPALVPVAPASDADSESREVAPPAPPAPRLTDVVARQPRVEQEAAPAPRPGVLSPTSTVRVTAILVSPTVSRRLEEFRRAQRGRTNTSILLQALDECHTRIPDLVAAARAAAQPRGSLFPARDDRLRLPGGGGMQVQVRPTLAQLDVIDGLARTHGLDSRSQLAAAVLNEFLPGRKDR